MKMTGAPPDGSRDRRIEDLSNLHVIHPAARWLLPRAIERGVSANAVSVTGLLVGIAATACYVNWPNRLSVLAGFLLTVAWLILDGLDGMIARATGTASRTGRILDGVCDHGVFILIYVGLATSLHSAVAWAFAIAAGAAHVLQSMLYEGERTRFHRRLRGQPPAPRAARVPVYDHVALAFDAVSGRLDELLVRAGPQSTLVRSYTARAVAPLRVMALLSANVRVAAIFLACLAGWPAAFWWFELGPLTLVAIITMIWHRQVETSFLARDKRPALG